MNKRIQKLEELIKHAPKFQGTLKKQKKAGILVELKGPKGQLERQIERQFFFQDPLILLLIFLQWPTDNPSCRSSRNLNKLVQLFISTNLYIQNKSA